MVTSQCFFCFLIKWSWLHENRCCFCWLFPLFYAGLIEQRKCAGSEEIVKERITKLQQQWEYLVQKSSEKSQHLKESNQQQQFNNNVKELDFWLGEVRKIKFPDLWSCVGRWDHSEITWRFMQGTMKSSMSYSRHQLSGEANFVCSKLGLFITGQNSTGTLRTPVRTSRPDRSFQKWSRPS